MRYVIYGAGGIGGTIGAMLQLAGANVLFIARGEHGQRLQAQGLRFVNPRGARELPVAVVSHPSEVGWQDGDLVLLCVKSQHSQAALADLRGACSAHWQLPVVCAQNGVQNEVTALRYFRRVYGMLVQLPGIHLTAGEVACTTVEPAGVLDTGCYPEGIDPLVETLCSDLRSAGFSATPDARIMRKKYSKLVTNTLNSVQAMLPLTQLNDPSVRGLLAKLRREALDCYQAAGIECLSGQAFGELTKQLNYQPVPGFDDLGGSSWQSLQRGTGDVEADYLNGEIVRLGRLHGVATPANEACQQLVIAMAQQRSPPGGYRIAQIEAQVAALESS